MSPGNTAPAPRSKSTTKVSANGCIANGSHYNLTIRQQSLLEEES